MATAIAQTAVNGALLDDARDRLASIEVERATIRKGREHGERQLADIAAKRRALTKFGADPDEAAQALLAGETVDGRLADDEVLQREAAAVRAGLAALARRDDQLKSEREQEQQRLQQHAAEALVPAVDRLEAAAVEAFTALASAYAGAAAIGETTGGPGFALATALRPVLQAAHRTNLVEPGLFATAAIDVPKAVELALEDQREAVRLAGKQPPRIVPFPIVTAR